MERPPLKSALAGTGAPGEPGFTGRPSGVCGTASRTAALCLSLWFGGLSNAMADTDVWPWLNVKGLLFGDLYTVPSHHLESGDGATGVVLRRGYLTFDADFSEDFDGRLRFELNQSGEFETYDFDGTIKDLWLGWNLSQQRLLAGKAPTPTFALIESQWGKRYLMRTPMDLQGSPSRDTGLSLAGPIDPRKRWRYHAMLGTGWEFGDETIDGLKWMLAVDWWFAEGWVAQVYLDHQTLDAGMERSTLQGFLAFKAEDWRWGLQYSDLDQDDRPSLRLASGYFIRKLADSWELITRVDRLFDPSPRGNDINYIPFDPTTPATLYLAGVEWSMSEHLSFTPNAVVIDYDRRDDGTVPDTDILLRLTANFVFD